MPRIAKHSATGPKQVGKPEDNLWVCQCGLSTNSPFCDGSHKKTQDEDPKKLYEYDEQGGRRELCEDAENGKCGSCCCN